MFKVAKFSFYDVYDVKKGRFNLSGYDCIVGNPEKRYGDEFKYNTDVIQVELPYTCRNYSLFYKTPSNILYSACFALCELLNNDKLTERQKSPLYKILVNSLHVVHHISTEKRHSKLNGINSLSTSCVDNCYCVERMKNKDSVCSKCYSNTQQKTQLALQDRNIINGVILRNIVIPAKYWKKYINPVDISKFFRFESFGDVANKTQALNYIEFCKAFPRVHFAVWTKNTGIWHFAFLDSDKPKNLSYIVSSNKLNKPELWRMNSDKNINHIFTVYDETAIEENKVVINCGGRSCMDCIKRHKACYFTDTETIINEQLK